jgi:ArsR family transcriptional regulator
VSALAQIVDESLPAISQRLKVLRLEGIVRGRREGKHIYYELSDDHVRVMLDNVLAHAAEDPPPSADRSSM